MRASRSTVGVSVGDLVRHNDETVQIVILVSREDEGVFFVMLDPGSEEYGAGEVFWVSFDYLRQGLEMSDRTGGQAGYRWLASSGGSR